MNAEKANQQECGNSKSAKAGNAIVLVHGGFVDGSGWAAVYGILKKKGYGVSIVQNPTKTLAEDVAFTKAAIENLDGNVVLVGHSYGGVVITEAGVHPKVSALVYVTAFAPDTGESVGALIANPPPGAPVPPILPPKDGFLFLDRTLNRKRRHSWPIPRCLGVLKPCRAKSRRPLGRASRVFIWSPRTTK
jgi:pimeloyl-ACP methyl ester carboxylesterase